MKLKLLFITYTHSNGGGAEAVLTTLVNNLDRSKYDIAIQEIEYYGVKKEPVRDDVVLLPPLIKNGRSAEADVVRYLLAEHPEALKPLQCWHGYDAIISWNYQKPSFCLRGFFNEKKIGWFHGDIYDLSQNTDGCLDLQRKAWQCADRLVTISNNSYKSLSDLIPELASKCTIIRNSIDAERIATLSIQEQDLSFFKTENPILVSVGQLDDNKNQKLLLEAAALLKKANKPCEVLILGRGAERESLEKTALDLGIAEFVYFVGYQKNPYPFIKKADIMCVTSFSEGFPTVVLEAMALGKPFVTTPVSGSSDELSCDGACGLVAGWDASEWADAIDKLAFDAELYGSMSKNCLDEVRKYSVENAIRCFDELIDSVISETNSPSSMRCCRESTRFKAVACFANAWAFKRYSGLEAASSRFSEHRTIINLIKTGYRILIACLNAILSPLRFATGFLLGYMRGVRR